LAWRRPTLPCLEAQYHGRCGVSRPSSEWDRVGHPCCDHQANETPGAAGPPLFRGGARAAVRADWHGMGRRQRTDGQRPDDSRGERSGLPAGLCSVPCRLFSELLLFPLGRGRSLERLGPVSCARRRACTSGLSTWWSTTALMARPGFEVGFPLRCFQRLSRPCLATRLRGWRHDRSTRGTSTPVLSY
jgi:hypothetical protein